MTKTNLDAQNEALVARLATDAGARNELIELNLRLVYVTIRRTLHLWPNFHYLRDDLIAEGMLALVKAVDKLVEVGTKTRPIRNYLITAIRHQLIEKLVGDRTNQGRLEQITQYVDSYNRVPEHILAKEDPSLVQLENHEFFYSLCESKRAQEILDAYLAGKNPIDIAHATGYTSNVVQKTLAQLREKLRESEESKENCRVEG